ncbi:MAG TPA: hypothetical protein VFQ91_25185 [Bryobacteraceae bacterium]|nr:hypothetical protein [Bryobacteraceae bacterium]
MQEYSHNSRVLPVWVAVILTVPLALGTADVFGPGWSKDAAAGLPLFIVFWYLLGAIYCNRYWVRVTWEGITQGHGPVPFGPAPPLTPRSDVAKVYVRHAVLSGRFGSHPYLAAGVEKIDGSWMDLSPWPMEDEKVWAEAKAIADALAWPYPVAELWGRPPKMDWGAAKPVLYWSCAVVAGFCWGLCVELFLRH